LTVNEKIVQAMKPFGLPVVADFFGGGNKEYITFNYSDSAALSGDDRPVEDVAEVQIHYFLPMDKDYLDIKRRMRAALLDAGFTYPDATVLAEPDGKTRHIIFECEVETEDELPDE